MARTPQDVTDAELAILQVLWERGPANRRQLTDRLYPGGNPAHYTTVQKLLERLEAKGYVAQESGPGVLTFRATISRDDLISRRLLDMAEKLCEGSVTPLLMNLVRANRLSGKELQELRTLIDELKQPPKPKRSPR
ncbi:MAG TPA: BlaI/MecI/CopY family transcriptional regulator [Gemmataceae bacterium]|nr:BlaI/MecI/CopY family transcriptional regulator [Gemmataceae bacterium]